MPSVPRGSDLAALIDNLELLEDLARREDAAYADLARQVAPSPVGRVPLLDSDVHDLGGLGEVADQLFGQTPATGRSKDGPQAPGGGHAVG
jgi:hypothetical protein